MAEAQYTLPLSFYKNFGISPEVFAQAFDNMGNGTFALKEDWSLAFTHAMMTTGDHPTTIAVPVQSGQPVHGSSAGDLWRQCTGNPVTEEKCCVYNCPNRDKCDNPDGKPYEAGATAHVYAKTQTSDHDISYMILLPTCSGCNNWMQCKKSQTNYPLKGELANVLYTVTGAQLMFIQVRDIVAAGKGAAGKGKGKGGGFGPDFPPGRPKDAKHFIE